MKILKTGVLLILVIFLCVNLSYAQTAKEHFYKGLEYSINGDFEKAKVEFRKTLDVDPSYEMAKKSLKIIEDMAKEKIKKETAIHLFKATNYGNKEMLGEAVIEYKKAIEINPDYAKAYNGLGITYFRKKMLDEAIVEFKKAIEINSDYVEAHYHLGAAYFKKSMLDEAIIEFKKAIKIDPDYTDAYYNLAIVYYFKKEYKLAIQYCDKAVQLGYKSDPKFLKALEPYRKP